MGKRKRVPADPTSGRLRWFLDQDFSEFRIMVHVQYKNA